MRRFRWYWRLRRRVPVFWLGALVLAGVTGLVVVELVGSAARSAERYGSLRVVPVVARPVDVGSVVARDDVSWRSVPRAFLPAAAVAPDPVGRTAVVPLVVGEVVVQPWLAPWGVKGAAALVPVGWRAVAVPVGDAALSLRRGDHVDVLASATGSALSAPSGPSSPSAAVAAHDALVVDVSLSAVTIAVPAADAPAVASAAATVTLALIGGAPA